MIGKRVLLSIFLFISFNSFLFAAVEKEIDNKIMHVEAQVVSESYVPMIYYDGKKLEDNTKILDANNQKFDISKDGETHYFTVRVVGNQDISRNLKVIVTGREFLGAFDNSNTNLFVSVVGLGENYFGPTVANSSIYERSLVIPRGPHSDTQNVVETSFKLRWKGNSDIPSGYYTSTVDIEYSVEN